MEPAGAMAGVRPSDEHQPRIWNAIAMWVGGGTTIAASTLLSLPSGSDVSALRALAGFCFAAAAFSFVVFRPASNRALYVLTNTFSTLGALTVWLACHWSGGQASGLIGLYFFPVLYDAYFFRRPHMLAHLVLNSALVVSPLAYGTATAGAQFPGRLAVTLLALWGMSALVGARKRRLLAAELSTRRQALSDPLTGVHNVRSVRRLIERRSADPEPADAQCAALMIDIDDFKDMNGRHGHLGADGLLRELASALQSLAHEGDCVARIGGDEFAMLVFGRSEAELGRLAEQCAAAVSTAHRRAGLGSARVSASVGFAHSRRHGANLERLLQLADEAMYERKAARSRGGANLTLVPGEGAPPGGHGAEGAHEKPAASDPLAPATHPSPSAPEIASAPATGISLPARLRSRPTQVKVAAAAWLSGAGATALVLVLPHADRSHLAAVIALTVAAVLVGSLLLALSPAAGG
ncbi:MAG: GGDEF domain-containing protein, partial [Acidobacteriota bacterium]|nr:GGDEF domain-containing protein [Acidobacteriota bacterium]